MLLDAMSTMFKKITIIDDCGLTNPVLEKLAILSTEPITIFYDFPNTDDEIIERTWILKQHENLGSTLKVLGIMGMKGL